VQARQGARLGAFVSVNVYECLCKLAGRHGLGMCVGEVRATNCARKRLTLTKCEQTQACKCWLESWACTEALQHSKDGPIEEHLHRAAGLACRFAAQVCVEGPWHIYARLSPEGLQCGAQCGPH